MLPSPWITNNVFITNASFINGHKLGRKVVSYSLACNDYFSCMSARVHVCMHGVHLVA